MQACELSTVKYPNRKFDAVMEVIESIKYCKPNHIMYYFIQCCQQIRLSFNVVTNPANGDVIGEVPDFGSEDTKKAIDAAYKAFYTWKKTTARVRLFSLYTDKEVLLVCLLPSC